jgi:hypothetical protein
VVIVDLLWVKTESGDQDAFVPGGGLLLVRRVPGNGGYTWSWVVRLPDATSVGHGLASAKEAKAAAEYELSRLRK